MHTFFYISSNEIWSGSEELWVRSAKLRAGNFPVEIATSYRHPQIDSLQSLGIKWFNLNAGPGGIPFLKRLAVRFRLTVPIPLRDLLKEELDVLRPSLVILSQGNNISSLRYMQLCRDLKIPYVTLTQLVAEVHWLWMNDDSIQALRGAYENALANYFVSKANLQLNALMIGCELSNARVAFNPSTVALPIEPTYPPIAETWDIAAVGRLECFHKGYDLLLQVMRMEKWKARPLKITFYGDGPHKKLLRHYAEQHQLCNIHFAGHTDDIKQVWDRHQMLILPSRMEGQSLALIEAMYCYRGIICTNVGGAAELVEEGTSGFIAETASLESIDQCLERAWEKRLQWREIGMNAGKAIREKYPSDPVAWFNQQLEDACK